MRSAHPTSGCLSLIGCRSSSAIDKPALAPWLISGANRIDPLAPPHLLSQQAVRKTQWLAIVRSSSSVYGLAQLRLTPLYTFIPRNFRFFSKMQVGVKVRLSFTTWLTFGKIVDICCSPHLLSSVHFHSQKLSENFPRRRSGLRLGFVYD